MAASPAPQPALSHALQLPAAPPSSAKSPAPPTASKALSSDVFPLPRPQAPPGLRVPLNKRTIYDRNLHRTRGAQLSRASFAYLVSEMVLYAQARVTGVQDLERRLSDQGYPIGLRMLALLPTRAPARTPQTRPHRVLALLQFITTTLWRALFARNADSLERANTSADQSSEAGKGGAKGGEPLATDYMVADNDPLVNMSISVPKELGALNCGAFVAGIIEGVCDGGGLHAKVSAHNAGTEMWPGRTVWLIRFDREVVEREAIVERHSVKGAR